MEDETDRERPKNLAALLRRRAAAFPDLPLEVVVDLVRFVELPPATVDAVADAVTTVLHNVRVHAHATSVVLHADADDGRWGISVRDDGVGFAPGVTELGYGLTEQVTRHLATYGVTAVVDSMPGSGTTVILTGRMSHE